ncbi:MAG TPA: hypothetical protein VFJ58_29195 [Armatimonadota bacterium]|nr:hypothetical protein [Armatimonadota bacterium]
MPGREGRSGVEVYAEGGARREGTRSRKAEGGPRDGLDAIEESGRDATANR